MSIDDDFQAHERAILIADSVRSHPGLSALIDQFAKRAQAAFQTFLKVDPADASAVRAIQNDVLRHLSLIDEIEAIATAGRNAEVVLQTSDGGEDQ